ncbi:MAG: hypothetical protein ACYDEJ_09555 [Desulfitobacteriaceae bacterium]
MSNEFVMGTEIRLTDMFTPRISTATAASRSFRESLFSLKGALTAVAGSMAIKASFDWLVKGNADMETYQNTLTTVMGSQEKAIETLKWAQNFAADTPFEIPQVVEATTKMAAYGLSAQKTLGIVGDMASVMGKDLMQAVEAVADGQMGQMERLQEFSITKSMIQDQAKMLGTNPVNNQGQITDQKAFNAALFSLMEKRFKGGMAMQSNAFWGMVANAKDFIGTIGRELGKPIFDSMKEGLRSTVAWLKQLKDSGAIAVWANNVKWAMGQVGRYFTLLKDAAEGPIKYIIYRARALHIENKPFLDKLGLLLGNLFNGLLDNGTSVFNWLMHDAIPKTINLLFNMGQKVLDVATYFMDNWNWIGPLVEGIAIATAGYLYYLGLAKAMTITATAAQWAWNVAMSANPIGLVVIGIGLLIGAGILLKKNWDTIMTKAGDLRITVENAFKRGVNNVIGFINNLIDVINKIPGVDIGHVEALQMGRTSSQKQEANWGAMLNKAQDTSGYTTTIDKRMGISKNPINGSHANGLSYVPFDGYRAELHRGERVLTASENLSLSNPGTKNSGTKSSTISKLADKIEIVITGAAQKDSKAMAGEILNHLYDMLRGADDILGSADMSVLL